DPLGHPFVVAADIELVDLGTVAALDDVLELQGRHRADQHADVAGARALGDRDAAARLERFERADRRQQHGNAELLAEDLRRRIDRATLRSTRGLKAIESSAMRL